MRQGQQNRRGRGRNNNNNNSGNRKSQNPLTRSFESTGPDVKLRGTPSHIAEKYMQLARDAHSSGDPVLAENYMQHAEHYNRIIMTFREQQLSQGAADPFANGMNRPARAMVGPQDPMDGGDEFGDDEGDEFGADQQPVAGGVEGGPAPQQMQPQPRAFEQPQQRYDNNNNNHRQHQNQNRNDHQRHGQNQNNRHDRGDRDGNRFDRNDRDGNRFDRPDRNQDRYDRGPRQDRNQDRNFDRNPDRGQDRGDFNAGGQNRNGNGGGNGQGFGQAHSHAQSGEPRGFRDDRPDRGPERGPERGLERGIGGQPQPDLAPAQPLLSPPPVAAESAAPDVGSQRRRERFQNQIRPAPADQAAPVAPAAAAEAHQPDFLRRPVRRPRAAAVVADPDAGPRTPADGDKD